MWDADRATAPCHTFSESSFHDDICLAEYVSIRECKPGGYFSKPGLHCLTAFKPGYPGLMVGHLSVADSQIVYYKQMEVWLARYLDIIIVIEKYGRRHRPHL